MTHNSSVNFKVINFLLWPKGSHQSSNFDIFECSCENLPNPTCHFPSKKSVFFQFLHPSSMSWNMILLYFFSQTTYTLLKRGPLKKKSFRLWVLMSKFVIFLMPILKGQVNSSPNFASLFSFMKANSYVLCWLKKYILCSKEAH